VSLIIREEEPPDDAVVVVRGGLVAAESIRRTAELSPERYKRLRTSTVAAVRSGGFGLLATGEWPHYDIVLANLGDTTIEALRGCFGPPLANPGGSETMERP
jgi:hypothetical protein